MYNNVVLIGRLTKDITIKEVGSNKVANFSLAVSRPYSKDVTDFFNCVAWREKAQLASDFLGKGDQILVDGQLQNSSYKDANGGNRTVTNVVVDKIVFIDIKMFKKDDKKTTNDKEVSPSDFIKEDDLPF